MIVCSLCPLLLNDDRRIRVAVALLLLRRLPMMDHPSFTGERKLAIVRHCELVSLPAISKGRHDPAAN
jgi:hypothetical protein